METELEVPAGVAPKRPSVPRDYGSSEAALDSELKRCKRALRILLRTAYSGERLHSLLAHSRSGEVDIRSCCYFPGGSTHRYMVPPKSTARPFSRLHRYPRAFMLRAAWEAEWALYRLGFIRRPWKFTSDELRGRRLAPMVRAEIRRRLRPERQPRLVWSRS